MAKGSGVIGIIDTCLKEGLKLGDKRASKAFENKERNAITACCIEEVHFSND